MITYHQQPDLMPSITMWSAHRYIRILFYFIVLGNDVYAIVLFFRFAEEYSSFWSKNFFVSVTRHTKKFIPTHHQGWPVLPWHTTLLVVVFLLCMPFLFKSIKRVNTVWFDSNHLSLTYLLRCCILAI